MHEIGDNRRLHDVRMMDDELVDSDGRKVEEAEMHGALCRGGEKTMRTEKGNSTLYIEDALRAFLILIVCKV